jgi:hypothetical protein
MASADRPSPPPPPNPRPARADTRTRRAAAVLAAGLLGLLPPARAAAPDAVDFNRDVRPLLSNTCLRCHGPDVKGNPSGLRLDQPQFALAPHRGESGREVTAWIPGKPAASEAWRRITSTDPAEVMPPPEALHQLSAADKATLRRWIEQGARYATHWAYVPPVRPPLPPPTGDGPPTDHPIDRLLAANLAARGLGFSPPADPRTLLRRLSLDLTGLPPTAAEAEAFAGDPRPAAYREHVERLLASPRYGERMAVAWLDLVRFADSTGLHGDQLLNNFPYRDYVIGAFNRNLPFDRFTTEQLAGDLLPGATDEQRVASGFNRLNMVTREGGAQTGEYLAKYAADRVRTVSTAWLGSTLACAECHDHKYDPFTLKDFYAFAAYFADVKQWGVYRHFVYTPEPELAVHTDDYPFPPEIEVESPYLRAREARLRAARDAALDAGGARVLADPAARGEALAWATATGELLRRHPDGWRVLAPAAAEASNDVSAETLPDGSVRLRNPPAAPADGRKRAETRVELAFDPGGGPVSSLRLEALPDEAHGGRVTRDGRALFEVKLAFALRGPGGGEDRPLEPAEIHALGETETYFNGRRRVSLRPSWRSSRAAAHAPQAVVAQFRTPVRLRDGERLVLTVTNAPPNFHQRDFMGEPGRLRVAVSPLAAPLPGEALAEADRRALLSPEAAAGRVARLYHHAVRHYGAPEAAEARREILECNGGRASSMITVATEPRVTRVLPRGNWQDESGEIVRPAPPRFLAGGSGPEPGAPRATRLDLARWLTAPENPLTARTFVNRLWRQFFGRALSGAVEDLGLQGEYPSHPELLDWLAVEFRESGWDVKALVRLIVSSRAYRQSSRAEPRLREVDPENRWLARQSARRLEAEFVRDNALFAAGLLNGDLGGPSAAAYQPPGHYDQLNFPLREYVAHRDERQYRRGLYLHWQRTFLHPMLANFDAPSREECTAARAESTTPQQALTLLNDPTFVEAARALAERVLPLPADRRLEAAFLHVLARPPEPREADSLRTFLAAQEAAYRSRPADAAALSAVGLRPPPAGADPAELAAWTAVARALLNLHETIIRY